MNVSSYSNKGSDKFPTCNSVNTSNVNHTSEIRFYNHPLFGQIRTVMVNDEPYFVGNDIATSLGYAKPRNAITQHVENEDALKWGIPDNQGLIQDTTIINESGMYSLVFGSKLPTAKDFKHWVTKDVLPTIRKTGSYSLQVPKSFSGALILAAQQQLQIEEQQKLIERKDDIIASKSAQISELEKESEYTRVILQNKGTTLVTQIAQDYGMSARKFNALLRDFKIQHKVREQWILYAPYINCGYVQSATHPIKHKDGRDDVSLNTEWTQKGRLFLYEELKKNNILPLIERQ